MFGSRPMTYVTITDQVMFLNQDPVNVLSRGKICSNCLGSPNVKARVTRRKGLVSKVIMKCEFFKTVFAKCAHFWCVLYASAMKRFSKSHNTQSFVFFANKIRNELQKKVIKNSGICAPGKTWFSSIDKLSGMHFTANFGCKPVDKTHISVNDAQSTGVQSSFSIFGGRLDFNSEATFSVNDSSKVGKLFIGHVHSSERTIFEAKCLA